MSVNIGPEQKTNFNFNSVINSNAAYLFIYVPQQHAQQVIRPYTYQFTENMVDKMLSPYGMDEFLNFDKASHDVKTAITPSGDGITVDTTLYENYYTFLLIIDNKEASSTILRAGGPGVRTIYCGYFIDEPLPKQYVGLENVNIPLNEQARMIITHCDVINTITKQGPMGTNNVIRPVGASDVVHQCMAQNSAENLMMCDFSTIVESNDHNRHSGNFIRNGNPESVGELDISGKGIPNALKSPKNQMLDIAHAINSGYNSVADVNIEGGIQNEMGGYDIFDNVSANILNNLSTNNSGMLYKYFDPTQPLPLGQLEKLFPYLVTRPFNMPNKLQMDVEDPTIYSVENVVSSMITNVVDNYARSCALTTISFRYDSWARSMDSIRSGQWEIISYSSTAIHQSGNPIKKQINDFMMLMESGLFPLIKAYSGETDFSLIVSYDGTNNTTVCLNYLDNAVNRTGFIITHNKLGGNITPILGNNGHFENNKSQLSGLINNSLGVIVGSNHPDMAFANSDDNIVNNGESYPSNDQIGSGSTTTIGPNTGGSIRIGSNTAHRVVIGN